MEINWWALIYFFLVSVLSFFAYAIWEAGYFKRRGMKNLPFDFPIVGNMYKAVRGQEHFMESVSRTYNAFSDEKYVGFMQINKPIILVRDLELIKQIAIKDFEHFLDHQHLLDEHVEPVFGNNLFALKGKKWRDMRATLSPAFTSSKMRTMFTLVDEIGVQMTKFYLKQVNEPEWKERGLIEVELKDAFTRYANDVIASTAFGLAVNSLENRDNEFYNMGKKATDVTGLQQIKIFLYTAFPKFMRLTGIKLLHSNVRQFFRSIILGTMKNREENGISRPDLIQLLIEATKGSLKYEPSQGEGTDAGFATVEESSIGKQVVKRIWTENDIVAQPVLFFFAGFDTASSLLCSTIHELTINPSIQKKLQKEVDELIAEKGDTLNYNDLMKMKYMDMVVTETLRLWPPVVFLDRQCVRSYSLPPPNDSTDKGYTVKPGEVVWFPVRGIHRDPKYYPNPEKFDPERFSEENKSNINPMAFLPFGMGPRNCIGSRFGLMETKAVVFHLVSKFDFVMTAKTENPIQISGKSFNPRAANGYWIGLQPRN